MPVKMTMNRMLQQERHGLMSYDDLQVFSGSSDELDKMIDWKAGSVAVLRHYAFSETTPEKQRSIQMQRQFTIELRVDFEDAGKLGPLKKVLQQAARHAYATAQLISDNPKTTQIAVYSEDFFSGHEEIKLLDDVIEAGLAATQAPQEDNSISNELLSALK